MARGKRIARMRKEDRPHRPNKRAKVQNVQALPGIENEHESREHNNAWEKGKAQVAGQTTDDASSDEQVRIGIQAWDEAWKKLAAPEEPDQVESTEDAGRPYSSAWKKGKVQVDDDRDETLSDEEFRKSADAWWRDTKARQQAWKETNEDLKKKARANARREAARTPAPRGGGGRGGQAKALRAAIRPIPRVHIELPEIDWSVPIEKPPRYIGRDAPAYAKMMQAGPIAPGGPPGKAAKKTAPGLSVDKWLALGYDIRMGHGGAQGYEHYIANEPRGVGEYGFAPFEIEPPKKRIRFGQDLRLPGQKQANFSYHESVRALMRTAKWVYLECARYFYGMNTFRIHLDFRQDLNDPIGRVSELFAFGVRRLYLDFHIADMEYTLLGAAQFPPLVMLKEWMRLMENKGYGVGVPWKITEHLPPRELQLPANKNFPDVDTPGWQPGWDEDTFHPARRLKRTIEIHPHYPFIKTLSQVHWGPIIRRLHFFRAELNVTILEHVFGHPTVVNWISMGRNDPDRYTTRQEKVFMKPIEELFDFLRRSVTPGSDYKFGLSFPDDGFYMNGIKYGLYWPGNPGAPRPPDPYATALLDYFGDVLRPPGAVLVPPAPPAIPKTGRGSRMFRLD
ncbi:hypothetical protein QBC43DRAFT_359464 [Cladorrhinum sp. PSN259]|nr:hypothetical protein QBC43DRAFT_359464 [Cladorrhinum sp. PSN259]